jgi:hypothetical protein
MTSSEYVAGQAQIEVPSAAKMGGPTGVTFVFEKVAHAIRVSQMTGDGGQMTSVCDREVFPANPPEWPPSSGTAVATCAECLSKAT